MFRKLVFLKLTFALMLPVIPIEASDTGKSQTDGLVTSIARLPYTLRGVFSLTSGV